MLKFFSRLFSADFMPHVYCLREPGLIALHAATDAVIALSYFIIPATLWQLLRKRRDLAFPWMFALFAIFILGCGTTHLLAVVTLWNPVYRLDGLLKALTAVASIGTAILLYRLLPQLMLIPSPQQLRAEIAERERAERQLQEANRHLEERVAARTAELESAARRLAESEFKMRRILDGANSLVYVKDLEGRFLFANKALLDRARVAEDQVIGHPDAELFPPEFLAEYRANDQLVLENGPRQFEEIWESGDRSVLLSNKFALTGLDGRPYAICGILSDITGLKRTERALRRSNEELEQFAYAAAHDLQEPLRNVANSLGFLSRRLGPKIPPDEAQWMRESIKNAIRMQGMVKDLLLYSRAVTDNEPPRAPLDANLAVEEALLNLKTAIAEADATVRFEPLPRVAVHEPHLVMIFQNLIGNAVKYRKPDQPPVVEIKAEHLGTEWSFAVSDNGIGFDPAYADRIFKVFKRLHSRDRYSGNGIGLAVCARIVAHYGGRIWAEAAVGQGATFRFTLPAPKRDGELEVHRSPDS